MYFFVERFILIQYASVSLLTSALNINPATDFMTALSDCSNQGLLLPVAQTYQEYGSLIQYISDNNLSDDVWLGLSVPTGESQYKWILDDQQNGHYVTTYWADNEPNHIPEETCVRLKSEDNFLWNTRGCSKDSSYICVNYTNSDTDFSMYSNEVTYEEARSDCLQRGTDLPLIKTLQTQTMVVNYINTFNNIDNIWIGLRFTGDNNEDFREFRWIDGEYLDTENWEKEPINSITRCVYLDSTSGFAWKRSSCSSTKPYICTPSFITRSKDHKLRYKITGTNKEPYSEALAVYTVRSLLFCGKKCSEFTSCGSFTLTSSKICKLFKYSNLAIYRTVMDTKTYTLY